MKSVNLIPMGIISVILLACANETDQLNTVTTQETTFLKVLGTTAGNAANPYDAVGQTYKNLLVSYKSGNYSPTDYAGIAQIVSALSGRTLSPELQNTLSTILNDPKATASSILNASELSNEAKDLLSGFIHDYDRLSIQPFDVTFNEISDLESQVISNPSLPDYDQRVILSLMSITRYALYHSCCEDTDWEKSVGNVVAALAGTLESNADGTIYALIVSIAGLEKIQL